MPTLSPAAFSSLTPSQAAPRAAPRVLADLKTGSRFRVRDCTVSGRLVSRNGCEALVELDGGPSARSFETLEGKRVTLPAHGRRVAMSLQTEVEGGDAP